MASSGSCLSNDEENNVGCLMKWPLEYSNETKEYTCGWCDQVLTANHFDLETHFKSCKNSKEDILSLVFKELGKVNRKINGLNTAVSQVNVKVDEMKAEFETEILVLRTETKESAKMSAEARDGTLFNLFRKVKVLEEKMAEVNGRVSGVTETISTVVHSVLDAKRTEVSLSSAPDRSKKETEALCVRLRNSEKDARATKTQLKEKVASLKTETLSGQLKTKDSQLQLINKQLLLLTDERAKNNTETRKISFHSEPSPLDQLAVIPMNRFNLVTRHYLFRPSFKWTIDDIRAITARKTFELSGEMFQWSGYPVQARAKLLWKEDDCVYVSLCLDSLEDVLKGESEAKEFTPIPAIFYMLKDKSARNPKHKICQSQMYLFSTTFRQSLRFNVFLARKSWFNDSTYNLDDSVEIEIYVEPSPMAQQVHSYDGTLEWSMENYAKRLQLEKDGLVYNQQSPYFYTAAEGYRVQVRVYLNGVKGREGPNAKILFLTGKFDAELAGPFPHSTTVTLMNRKKPESSISKTIVKDIIGRKMYYVFKICQFEEMKNVVVNDALYCKVSIQSHYQTM